MHRYFDGIPDGNYVGPSGLVGIFMLYMIMSVLSSFGVKLCAQSPCDVVFEVTREVDCCIHVVKKENWLLSLA